LKVPPGKEYLITLNFASNEEGLFVDTLIINSNAYNSFNGISKVTLYAYKGILKYSFSSDTLNFKLLTQSSRDTLNFKFSNSGSSNLKLKFVTNNPLFKYSYPEKLILLPGEDILIDAYFEGSMSSGIYHDDLIFEDSCGKTIKITLIAEVTDKIDFFSVSLPFPNPTKSSSAVIIRSTEEFIYSYRLLDNLGKLIIDSKNLNEKTKYGRIELNLDRLSIGVYILEIKTTKGIFTRKIIKLQ
jgi:hypothetical protein